MTAQRFTQHVNAPRAAVYRALLDPVAVATWMVPDGMSSHVHAFDAREGGAFRISLTYDAADRTGKTQSNTDTFHGRFVALVPDEQVTQTIEFETADPSMRGAMTITYARATTPVARPSPRRTRVCRPACDRRTTSSAGACRSPSWRAWSSGNAGNRDAGPTFEMSMRRVSIFLTGVLAAAALAEPAHAGPAAAAFAGDPDQLSDVAEQVVSSVVNISTTRQVDLGPAASDPFFTDPDSPFYLSPDQRKQSALGSGVIVGEHGRVLTNAHVVDGADTIKVTLADGSEFDAKVVGVDKRSDLAVVQMQGDLPKLKAIAFGDSSKIRLAQPVLAVGDPFGVGQTVTMGIVSAKGRASVGIEDYEDFIQTDAAINPGNSGGALINLRGELVGINTAILSRSGGYQGVGFAIPSNMAKPIMDALVKDGKVSRGYLGVGLRDLTRELAVEQKISATRGVLVEQVVPQSPADKAGMHEHDLIVSVDGAAVTDRDHLRNAIAMKGAGAKVQLEVLRGKRTDTLTATLVELPEQQQLQPQPQVRIHRR